MGLRQAFWSSSGPTLTWQPFRFATGIQEWAAERPVLSWLPISEVVRVAGPTSPRLG